MTYDAIHSGMLSQDCTTFSTVLTDSEVVCQAGGDRSSWSSLLQVGHTGSSVPRTVHKSDHVTGPLVYIHGAVFVACEPPSRHVGRDGNSVLVLGHLLDAATLADTETALMLQLQNPEEQSLAEHLTQSGAKVKVSGDGQNIVYAIAAPSAGGGYDVHVYVLRPVEGAATDVVHVGHHELVAGGVQALLAPPRMAVAVRGDQLRVDRAGKVDPASFVSVAELHSEVCGALHLVAVDGRSVESLHGYAVSASDAGGGGSSSTGAAALPASPSHGSRRPGLGKVVSLAQLITGEAQPAAAASGSPTASGASQSSGAASSTTALHSCVFELRPNAEAPGPAPEAGLAAFVDSAMAVLRGHLFFMSPLQRHNKQDTPGFILTHLRMAQPTGAGAAVDRLFWPLLSESNTTQSASIQPQLAACAATDSVMILLPTGTTKWKTFFFTAVSQCLAPLRWSTHDSTLDSINQSVQSTARLGLRDLNSLALTPGFESLRKAEGTSLDTLVPLPPHILEIPQSNGSAKYIDRITGTEKGDYSPPSTVVVRALSSFMKFSGPSDEKAQPDQSINSDMLYKVVRRSGTFFEVQPVRRNGGGGGSSPFDAHRQELSEYLRERLSSAASNPGRAAEMQAMMSRLLGDTGRHTRAPSDLSWIKVDPEMQAQHPGLLLVSSQVGGRGNDGQLGCAVEIGLTYAPASSHSPSDGSSSEDDTAAMLAMMAGGGGSSSGSVTVPWTGQPDQLTGATIRLKRDGRAWTGGTVRSFDGRRRKHCVRLDSGKVIYVDFREETFEVTKLSTDMQEQKDIQVALMLERVLTVPPEPIVAGYITNSRLPAFLSGVLDARTLPRLHKVLNTVCDSMLSDLTLGPHQTGSLLAIVSVHLTAILQRYWNHVHQAAKPSPKDSVQRLGNEFELGLEQINEDRNKALRCFWKCLDSERVRRDSAYNIACVCSRDREAQAAVRWFKHAVTCGYANVAHARSDEDFDNVRGDPEFERLLLAMQRLTFVPIVDDGLAYACFASSEHNAFVASRLPNTGTSKLTRTSYYRLFAGLRQFVRTHGNVALETSNDARVWLTTSLQASLALACRVGDQHGVGLVLEASTFNRSVFLDVLRSFFVSHAQARNSQPENVDMRHVQTGMMLLPSKELVASLKPLILQPETVTDPSVSSLLRFMWPSELSCTFSSAVDLMELSGAYVGCMAKRIAASVVAHRPVEPNAPVLRHVRRLIARVMDIAQPLTSLFVLLCSSNPVASNAGSTSCVDRVFAMMRHLADELTEVTTSLTDEEHVSLSGSKRTLAVLRDELLLRLAEGFTIWMEDRELRVEQDGLQMAVSQQALYPQLVAMVSTGYGYLSGSVRSRASLVGAGSSIDARLEESEAAYAPKVIMRARDAAMVQEARRMIAKPFLEAQSATGDGSFIVSGWNEKDVWKFAHQTAQHALNAEFAHTQLATLITDLIGRRADMRSEVDAVVQQLSSSDVSRICTGWPVNGLGVVPPQDRQGLTACLDSFVRCSDAGQFVLFPRSPMDALHQRCAFLKRFMEQTDHATLPQTSVQVMRDFLQASWVDDSAVQSCFGADVQLEETAVAQLHWMSSFLATQDVSQLQSSLILSTYDVLRQVGRLIAGDSSGSFEDDSRAVFPSLGTAIRLIDARYKVLAPLLNASATEIKPAKRDVEQMPASRRLVLIQSLLVAGAPDLAVFGHRATLERVADAYGRSVCASWKTAEIEGGATSSSSLVSTEAIQHPVTNCLLLDASSAVVQVVECDTQFEVFMHVIQHAIRQAELGQPDAAALSAASLPKDASASEDGSLAPAVVSYMLQALASLWMACSSKFGQVRAEWWNDLASCTLLSSPSPAVGHAGKAAEFLPVWLFERHILDGLRVLAHPVLRAALANSRPLLQQYALTALRLLDPRYVVLAGTVREEAFHAVTFSLEHLDVGSIDGSDQVVAALLWTVGQNPAWSTPPQPRSASVHIMSYAWRPELGACYGLIATGPVICSIHELAPALASGCKLDQAYAVCAVNLSLSPANVEVAIDGFKAIDISGGDGEVEDTLGAALLESDSGPHFRVAKLSSRVVMLVVPDKAHGEDEDEADDDADSAANQAFGAARWHVHVSLACTTAPTSPQTPARQNTLASPSHAVMGGRGALGSPGSELDLMASEFMLDATAPDSSDLASAMFGAGSAQTVPHRNTSSAFSLVVPVPRSDATPDVCGSSTEGVDVYAAAFQDSCKRALQAAESSGFAASKLLKECVQCMKEERDWHVFTGPLHKCLQKSKHFGAVGVVCYISPISGGASAGRNKQIELSPQVAHNSGHITHSSISSLASRWMRAQLQADTHQDSSAAARPATSWATAVSEAVYGRLSEAESGISEMTMSARTQLLGAIQVISNSLLMLDRGSWIVCRPSPNSVFSLAGDMQHLTAKLEDAFSYEQSVACREADSNTRRLFGDDSVDDSAAFEVPFSSILTDVTEFPPTVGHIPPRQVASVLLQALETVEAAQTKSTMNAGDSLAVAVATGALAALLQLSSSPRWAEAVRDVVAGIERTCPRLLALSEAAGTRAPNVWPHIHAGLRLLHQVFSGSNDALLQGVNTSTPTESDGPTSIDKNSAWHSVVVEPVPLDSSVEATPNMLAAACPSVQFLGFMKWDLDQRRGVGSAKPYRISEDIVFVGNKPIPMAADAFYFEAIVESAERSSNNRPWVKVGLWADSPLTRGTGVDNVGCEWGAGSVYFSSSDGCKGEWSTEVDQWPAVVAGDRVIPVGFPLDVEDRNGTVTWRPAVTIGTRNNGVEVHIHYLGWTSKWDEWIPLSSNRLAMRGRHTPGNRPDGFMQHSSYSRGVTVSEGDVIGCRYEPAHGEVSFTFNGETMGIACRGVQGELFPAISVTNSTVVLRANFGAVPFISEAGSKPATTVESPGEKRKRIQASRQLADQRKAQAAETMSHRSAAPSSRRPKGCPCATLRSNAKDLCEFMPGTTIPVAMAVLAQSGNDKERAAEMLLLGAIPPGMAGIEQLPECKTHTHAFVRGGRGEFTGDHFINHSGASFSKWVPQSPGISGHLVVAEPLDGSTPLTNADAVHGKFAIIERGGCTFVWKVRHAQQAGAKAVILVSDGEVSFIPDCGTEACSDLIIPAVMIEKSVGTELMRQVRTADDDGPTLTLCLGAPQLDLPPQLDEDEVMEAAAADQDEAMDGGGGGGGAADDAMSQDDEPEIITFERLLELDQESAISISHLAIQHANDSSYAVSLEQQVDTKQDDDSSSNEEWLREVELQMRSRHAPSGSVDTVLNLLRQGGENNMAMVRIMLDDLNMSLPPRPSEEQDLSGVRSPMQSPGLPPLGSTPLLRGRSSSNVVSTPGRTPAKAAARKRQRVDGKLELLSVGMLVRLSLGRAAAPAQGSSSDEGALDVGQAVRLTLPAGSYDGAGIDMDGIVVEKHPRDLYDVQLNDRRLAIGIPRRFLTKEIRGKRPADADLQGLAIGQLWTDGKIGTVLWVDAPSKTAFVRCEDISTGRVEDWWVPFECLEPVRHPEFPVDNPHVLPEGFFPGDVEQALNSGNLRRFSQMALTALLSEGLRALKRASATAHITDAPQTMSSLDETASGTSSLIDTTRQVLQQTLHSSTVLSAQRELTSRAPQSFMPPGELGDVEWAGVMVEFSEDFGQSAGDKLTFGKPLPSGVVQSSKSGIKAVRTISPPVKSDLGGSQAVRMAAAYRPFFLDTTVVMLVGSGSWRGTVRLTWIPRGLEVLQRRIHQLLADHRVVDSGSHESTSDGSSSEHEQEPCKRAQSGAVQWQDLLELLMKAVVANGLCCDVRGALAELIVRIVVQCDVCPSADSVHAVIKAADTAIVALDNIDRDTFVPAAPSYICDLATVAAAACKHCPDVTPELEECPAWVFHFCTVLSTLEKLTSHAHSHGQKSHMRVLHQLSRCIQSQAEQQGLLLCEASTTASSPSTSSSGSPRQSMSDFTLDVTDIERFAALREIPEADLSAMTTHMITLNTAASKVGRLLPLHWFSDRAVGVSGVAKDADTGILQDMLTLRGMLFFDWKLQWVGQLSAYCAVADHKHRPRFKINRIGGDAAGALTQSAKAINRQQGWQYHQLRTSPHLAFEVLLHGERVAGEGGPYREFFDDVCHELTSSTLLSPSSNQQAKWGEAQNAFIPRPSDPTPDQREMLHALGRLMGAAIRTSCHMPIALVSTVWKALCGQPCTRQDLRRSDMYFMTNVVQKLEGLTSEEEYTAAFGDQLMYSVTLSSGDTVSMVPRGESQVVPFADIQRYVDWAIKCRLAEGNSFVHCIRRGLAEVFPLSVLQLFTWQELETLVCGKSEIDLALLKKHTVYSGGLTASSPRVQQLWRVLETMSQDELKMFVRFAWGQERLPINEQEYVHEQVRMQIKPRVADGGRGADSPARRRRGREDRVLPRADVCFFNLELPEYSSEAIMRRQLLIAITHGGGLDADNVDAR